MLQKHSFCKVNLLLNILRKRLDGFHELETIMQPVDLWDDLDFERSGHGVSLTCNDPSLPVDSRNLVVRAALLFLENAKIRDGVRISLRKNLPVAAGLGGGSANAAITLLALNELFDYPFESEPLTRMAASLGSDVPFFLQSGPALATGRGEVVESLSLFPALRGACLLLAHPGFGISTPWAYSQLTRFPRALNGRPGRALALISLLQKPNPRAACNEFYNSLEPPALEKYPLLDVFLEFYRQHGALGALMSGSGSTTFAVCASKTDAEILRDSFKTKFGDKIWTAVSPLPH